MPAKRLLLHFGAHKTATTSLQVWFSQNRRHLIKNGIDYVAPSAITASGLLEYLHGHSLQPAISKSKHAKFLKHLADASRVDTLMISHESFWSYAGDPAHQHIYPSLEGALQRFADINPFAEIKMAFCFREYGAFLQSLYLQNLGNLIATPFEEYFGLVDLANLSWTPIFDKIEESALGPTEWLVYEDVSINGSRWYLARFAEWAGFPIPPPSTFKESFKRVFGYKVPVRDDLVRRNESLSMPAARMISASQLTYKNLEPKTRNQLRNALKTILPVSEFGKADFLCALMKEKICRHLRSDVHELSLKIKRPDLKSLWLYD